MNALASLAAATVGNSVLYALNLSNAPCNSFTTAAFLGSASRIAFSAFLTLSGVALVSIPLSASVLAAAAILKASCSSGVFSVPSALCVPVSLAAAVVVSSLTATSTSESNDGVSTSDVTSVASTVESVTTASAPESSAAKSTKASAILSPFLSFYWAHVFTVSPWSY